MRNYCCKPFKAHVETNFFKSINWPDLCTERSLANSDYEKSSWACRLLSMDGDFEFKFPEGDTNLAPMIYCQFCGTKLRRVI